MNNSIEVQRVKIVNAYLTPLSVILVLFAVVFSRPSDIITYISLGLLGIALLNNFVTRVLVKKYSSPAPVRMMVNVAVNIILVYILIGYWGPIWYLFLMTPVAAAVYSTRAHTLAVSLVISFLLAGIYLSKGVSSFQAWGQALSRIVLVIFLSLFINALVRQKKSES